MYKGNSSRVVPVIIVMIVVFIAIFALVLLGQAIFSGKDKSPAVVDSSQQDLLNTAATRSVRMTVRGPIVADENFRSYQVTVTPASRSLATYSGYLDNQKQLKELGNNVRAYEELVFALDKANMVKGVQLKDEADDTRGICATGNVYEFDVISEGKSVKHLWTSTCKGSPGSFKASVSQVKSLFLGQIPNSDSLVGSVDL